MSYAFDSRFGEYLYRLLPEVYRTRDQFGSQSQGKGTEDLAKYLDAHGELLDLIYSTFEQLRKDGLPESSQDWLLPYFAKLLAVNIVSPDSAGKHAEVDNAINWRQRKGTLKCTEQIAEAVGEFEVEIHEGWQRVAITPRINKPILPLNAIDDTLDINMDWFADAIRHPSLPAVTPDLRLASRAIEAERTNPAAKTSQFGGIKQTWRQLNRHGTPCFPNSYEDVTRRTVDFRTPNYRQGRFHHKRLLVHTAPQIGLIPLPPIAIAWAQRLEAGFDHLIEEEIVNGIKFIRNLAKRQVVITDAVSLPAAVYHVERIHFADELVIGGGGSITLTQSNVGRLDVATPNLDEAVITAGDCVFSELSTSGLVDLQRCSIVDTAFLVAIKAKDCIFNVISGFNISGVIEHCRIPDFSQFSDDTATIENCTDDEPEFFNLQTELAAQAVLAPGTPETIYFGASNGGEMGRYRDGRVNNAVSLAGDFTGTEALVFPNKTEFVLRDLIFLGQTDVTNGRLVLERVAFANLNITSAVDDFSVPMVDAIDSIFNILSLQQGIARLEYCTVMQSIHCIGLQASDCIFVGEITDGAGSEPSVGCIRFSRIPPNFDGTLLNVTNGYRSGNTREAPVFNKYQFCDPSAPGYRWPQYGEAGYAVLHPETPKEIGFGAEDGGEMGACHRYYHFLKAEAVIDKMNEFLPVGVEPVLIYDHRLLQVPPQLELIS